MVKRTSKKREKLLPLMERYLQVLEGKVPASQWREVFADNVIFDGARGTPITGFEAVTRQIADWHKVMDRVEIKMIRMVDYPGESADKRGGRTVKVDYIAKSIWIEKGAEEGIVVENPVIGMYEIREGLIEQIVEAWPRARIPPTVG